MDTFEVLTHVGLNKKEAAVYGALLDHGPATLTTINKLTHINRPALYDLLPRMIKKELIGTQKKQKRTLYVAESPQRLLSRYESEYGEMKERLEELTTTFEASQHVRPAIKYLEGRRGVLFVFDDVAHTLPRGGTFYRYSSRTAGHQKDFDNTYYKKTRESKGIERMVITSQEHAAKKTKKLERSLRVIPKEFDLFEDNVSLVIYANKTAYIDYSSNTSFIVESEKIARFQEKLFKLLWKKL